MNRVTGSCLTLGVAVGALLCVSARPVAAQQPDGFLFRQPVGSVGFHIGYSVPGAGSEVFDFVNEQLTVDRADFQGMVFGGEIAIRATDRVDLAFGLSISETKTASEFRDWVDGDDLPIEQTTSLRLVPVTMSAKVYLQDRGRKVGRLAWVPSAWAPYVGGGVGMVWYDFTQAGDFVDFETLEVFEDFLDTDGRAFAAHGLVGADFSLSPRVVLTGEGRYSWGKGDMGGDFVDFDALDLSGFRATAGIKLRF